MQCAKEAFPTRELRNRKVILGDVGKENSYTKTVIALVCAAVAHAMRGLMANIYHRLGDNQLQIFSHPMQYCTSKYSFLHLSQ